MPYLYVLAAIVLRLIPHPWNVTPMAAMFLFSGSTFRSKRDALLAPLLALMLSDYAVVHLLYHGQYRWFTPYTWIAFLLVGLIGFTLRHRITAARVAGASLAGSVVFFAVSNFGVWLMGTMYPKTAAGLAACYVAAIPFFRNTVLGDLFYAALMFGSYYWVSRRQWTLARQP
ncbi:MAG: hypothetical protein HY238_09800 [Acidobacteria bacterium]|nr:hypothetical protein [Acidobacteriota bacterium]